MSAINGVSGEVLWGTPINITGISAASSAVISIANTSQFTTGSRVIVRGVTGMTEINNVHGTVTNVVLNTSITVDINSTNFTAYGSGGTISLVIDVTKFSYTKKGATANVTDSASNTWEDHTPSGFVGLTGTFEGFLKSGVKKPTFHSVISFGFYETDVDYLTGSGIITDEGTSLEVNGTNAVQITFSFQGTGTYSDTNS